MIRFKTFLHWQHCLRQRLPRGLLNNYLTPETYLHQWKSLEIINLQNTMQKLFIISLKYSLICVNFTNQIYIFMHEHQLPWEKKMVARHSLLVRSQMLIQRFLLNNRNKFRNTMINYKSLLHRAICNDHLSNENQKFRTCYFMQVGEYPNFFKFKTVFFINVSVKTY